MSNMETVEIEDLDLDLRDINKSNYLEYFKSAEIYSGYHTK